jgi:aminopeptidase N
VELADPKASPFESGNMLMTPLNSDSRIAGLTVVHQLTHSTFPSPRAWIYEGLAHFAQAAYLEQQSGRRAALDFMAQHRTALVDAERSLAADRGSPTSANESLINTSREEFYRSKAMYVWWMMRDMVGEEALKKALALYRPDQDKEPSQVQRLIEAQSKRDLEWFFDDWIYRDRGLPDLRVESAYPRPLLGGGYVVTITVENLGEAGAQVPVTLRMERGEITRLLEVQAKSKSVLRIEAPGTPQEIVVNDGSVPERDMTNNIFKISVGTK